MPTKVLVLCATGKLGGGVAAGLKSLGLDVYGTTRSAGGAASLERKGIHPIVANYVVRGDVDRALRESGASVLVFLTDFFLAAGHKAGVEAAQGCMMVDAAKAAGIQHAIYLSVGDADLFDALDAGTVAYTRHRDVARGRWANKTFTQSRKLAARRGPAVNDSSERGELVCIQNPIAIRIELVGEKSLDIDAIARAAFQKKMEVGVRVLHIDARSEASRAG